MLVQCMCIWIAVSCCGALGGLGPCMVRQCDCIGLMESGDGSIIAIVGLGGRDVVVFCMGGEKGGLFVVVRSPQ